MAVNVTTDANTVTVLTTTTNNVKIVDTANDTTVSVTQPITKVVKISAVGPQGPKGDTFPFTGSAQITGSLGVTGSVGHGLNVQAQGPFSHAEGTLTIAEGYAAHAEGYGTLAQGPYSHAEGESGLALGQGSHAEGYYTIASGPNSHAEGLATVALGTYQHVQGQYNISSSDQSAFIIGNGKSNTTRSNLLFASESQVQITGSLLTTGSNIFTGNQSIQGDLTISGSNGTNSALFFLGGASVATIGANIDMTAGPGGWSELGSNNGQNYVWVDDTGLNLVTSWDSNTETSAWRIATGSRQLTAVGDLNMNGRSVVSASNLATTGSNSFVGNQIITGSLTVSGSSTFTNIGPAIFSGSITSTQGFTGSLQGTVATASYSLTASYALNGGGTTDISGLATTGSNTFLGNQAITGSLSIVNGLNGIPTGINNWQGQGGWNQAYYSNLATTGGTGTGLTVDVAAGGGGYITIDQITIHTPGIGYTNGDVITINNEYDLPGTLTVQVTGANSWKFDQNSRLVFPDATAQTTAFIPATHATTGSNTFIGTQIVTGSIKTTGTLTVQNTITTPSGQYFVASSDTSTELSWSVPFAPSIAVYSGIGSSNTGTSISNTSTDSNGDALPTKTWGFGMDGNLSVPGNITGAPNLATTGSVTFTGNQIVTGSTRGNITALSISSNTASINLSAGNFFTLQLVSGSNTYINPSNILPGQTSILTISTTGSATVSFPSSIKQPSGSAYVPTTTTGIDILTLASVDTSSLYIVSVKNMI